MRPLKLALRQYFLLFQIYSSDASGTERFLRHNSELRLMRTELSDAERESQNNVTKNAVIIVSFVAVDDC